MHYDAFISYSHRADDFRASALQRVLESIARPFYRRRALNIFRDQTSLTANPALWPSIERALQRARFFIILEPDNCTLSGAGGSLHGRAFLPRSPLGAAGRRCPSGQRPIPHRCPAAGRSTS